MKINRMFLGILSTLIIGVTACEPPPSDNLPIDITLSVFVLDMEVGDKAKIDASLVYNTENTEAQVRRAPEPVEPGLEFYVVDNKSFISVDGEGNVEALAVGIGKIGIAYNRNKQDKLNLIKYVDVEVKDKVIIPDETKPDEIKINNSDPTNVIVGNTFELDFQVLPVDAKNKAVDVTFSKDGIVSRNGNTIKGEKEGSVTITITSKEVSSVKASFVVNVNPTPTILPLSIIIEEGAASVSIVEGNTRLLTTRIEPDTASNKTLSWSSNNESVATVNPNSGVVSAIKEGSATITAVAIAGDDVKDTIVVNVTKKPSEVIIPSSLVINGTKSRVEYGGNFSVSVSAYPIGASNSVNWVSSKPSVASVVGGYISALSIGNTIITATSTVPGSTATASFALEVVEANADWPAFIETSFNDIAYPNLPSTSYIGKIGTIGPGYNSVVEGLDADKDELESYYRQFYVKFTSNMMVEDYCDFLLTQGWAVLYDDVSYPGMEYAYGDSYIGNAYYELEITGYDTGTHYEVSFQYTLTGTKDWPMNTIEEYINDTGAAATIPEYTTTRNPNDPTPDFWCFDEGNDCARVEIYNTNTEDFKYYTGTSLSVANGYTKEFFTANHEYISEDADIETHYVEHKIIKKSGGWDAVINVGLGELNIGETYNSFPLERIISEFSHDSNVNVSKLPSDNSTWWSNEYYVEVANELSNGKKEIHVYGKSSDTYLNDLGWVILGLKADGAYSLDADDERANIWRRVKGDSFYYDHYVQLAEDELHDRGLYLIISSI